MYDRGVLSSGNGMPPRLYAKRKLYVTRTRRAVWGCLGSYPCLLATHYRMFHWSVERESIDWDFACCSKSCCILILLQKCS
jgi:hypothetical protein